MKRTLVAALMMVVALCGVVSTAAASTITVSDNFNDGNADGFWLGTNPQGVQGTWRVENGTLAQDRPGDAYMALVQNLTASSQSLGADVLVNQPSGYGGFTIWYQDANNWTSVVLYNSIGIVAIEYIGGVVTTFAVYSHVFQQSVWHHLAVDANSSTGLLSIAVDHSPLLTHQTLTATRAGQSGFYSGNAGGYFDNFELSAVDVAVPEPASVLLLSTGALVLLARGRFRIRRRGTDR